MQIKHRDSALLRSKLKKRIKENRENKKTRAAQSAQFEREAKEGGGSGKDVPSILCSPQDSGQGMRKKTKF